MTKKTGKEIGRGFSRRNLFLIRSFLLTYRERMQTPSALSSPHTLLEVSQTLSGKFPFSWSYYVRLLPLDGPQKRDFYEEETQRAGWPVRQLDRQINAMLYALCALRDLGKWLQNN